MKSLNFLAVLTLLVSLCRPAIADEKPAVEAPIEPMERVLPTVDLQDVPIEEVVEYLQNAAPGFKAAVFRDAGVPTDYPKIKLKLKNVRVGDLWMLLQMAYPHVIEAQPVRDDGGPQVLFMVQVHNPPGGAPAEIGGVKVYRLSALLDAFGDRKAQGRPAPDKKEALNEVLSLIKAAMAQVPGKNDAVLQVHEETQSLVFKGTAEQRAALQEVLDALDPNMSPVEARIAMERQQRESSEQSRLKISEQASRLETELNLARQSLDQERQMSQSHALEAEKLKVRVEENRKIDKAKSELDAKAGRQALEQEVAELRRQVAQTKNELEEARKMRDVAEQTAMERAIEAEKLKIRLEAATRAADKGAGQSAPRPAATKE